MFCPACSNVELKIADRQEVEIDYCPQCRGVWLDRGELDKIIERSLPEGSETGDFDDRRREDYRKHRDGYRHRDHGYRGYKKKRSFWEDIFDLD